MIEQREHTEQHEQLAPVLTVEGTVDERETVFQTWCMLADRSPTRTAAKVRDEFGIEISADLVRKWSKRHDWDLRARELFEQTAPTFFERTRAALMAAGPPAATYILDVASGNVSGDKVRMIASIAAVDRLGFLPHTRREAERGQTPASHALPADEYTALSDEELRQAIASRVAHLAGN